MLNGSEVCLSSGLYSATSGIAHSITTIIEKIVSMKRDIYVGNMYDADDVAQEIRVSLFQASKFVDITKNERQIYYYLMRCADTTIGQLRRGVYEPNNPPCRICASGGACRSNGDQCDAWKRYDRTLKIKQSIDRPRPLVGVDIAQDWDASGPSIASELHEKIIAALPSNLLKSYHSLLNGQSIPTHNKYKIRKIVQELIDGEKDR